MEFEEMLEIINGLSEERYQEIMNQYSVANMDPQDMISIIAAFSVIRKELEGE